MSPAPLARRRSRRALAAGALAVLAAGLGAGALALSRADLEGKARARIESAFAAATGGSLRIGSLCVHPLRLEAEARDVSASVPAEGAEPLEASAARLRVKLAWQGLVSLGLGRVRLAEVETEAAQIALTPEFLAEYARREPRGKGLHIRVDRLHVAHGLVRWADRRAPLDLEARDVSIEASWSSFLGALAGEADLSISLRRPPFARPYPLRVRSSFVLTESRVELRGSRVTAPGLDGTFRANVARSEGAPYTGRVSLVADLGALGEWLDPSFPEIAGEARADLVLDGLEGDLRAVGPVRVREGRLGPIRATEASGRVEFHERRLAVRGLEARAFGGSLRGSVDVDLSDPVRFDARVSGSEVDVGSVLALARLPLPVSARAAVDLELRGEPAAPETWEGGGRIAAEPGPAALGIPARMEGPFEFRTGRFVIPGAALETEATRLDLAVDVALAPEAGMSRAAISGETRSGGRTLEEVLRVLGSLGIELPAIVREPIAGQGRFRTAVELGEDPAVEVDVDLAEGSWSGETFDRGTLSLRVAGGRLDLRSLALEDASQRLRASCVLDTASSSIERVDLEMEDVRLARVLRRLGSDLDADGRIGGSLALRRGAAGLEGGGEAMLLEGRVLGEPLELGRVRLEARDGVLEARDVEVSGLALEGRLSVRVGMESGSGDVRVESARLDVSKVAALRRRGLDVGGELLAQGQVRFGADGTTGEVSLAGSEFRIGEGRLGKIGGILRVSPDALGFEVEGREEARWRVAGSVGWEDSLPIRATAVLQRAEIPLSAEGGSGPRLRVSAEIAVDGPLATPEEMEGSGSLTDAEVVSGGRSASIAAPVPLRLSRGRFEAGPCRITGGGIDVEGVFAYRFADEGLSGRARGSIDLSALSSLVPGLKASGRLRLDLEVEGRADAPEIRGAAGVEEGRLRLEGFPLRLDGLDGRVRFEGRRFELEDVRALSGGGEILVRGGGAVGGDGIREHEIEFGVSRVAVEYPPGFRGVYEGRLVLAGREGRSRLSGELKILRGSYATDFDVAALLGTRGIEPVETSEEGFLGRVALGVRVRAEDGVWVRNNMARLESAVSLDLGGDLERPEVIGRISALEGGVLTFRGVDYRILSGTLDFSDPDRIDPYLAVSAETRVDRYDVRLRAEGRLEKFDYELTSDPPLSQQDVMALLLTGSTAEDWSEVAAGVGAGGLAASHVSGAYVAGAVAGVLGEPIKKSFGLDQLRIDPFLVEGQADPSTRVTVGKKLAEDVRLVYSVDLGDAEKSIYKVEWQATRHFQIAGLYDTSGSSAGDIRYSRRFRLGRPRGLFSPQPLPVASAGASLDGMTVESVAFAGAGSEEGARLARKLPLREGDAFRRSRMMESADEIRRAEAARDRFLARVIPEAVEIEGGVAVTYRVEPGPEVDLEIRGVPIWDRRRIRRRLVGLWGEPAAPEDLTADGEEEIRRYFRDRGYYAVDVVREENLRGVRKLVRYSVDRGRRVRIAEVSVEGGESLSRDEIRSHLMTRPDTAWSRRHVNSEGLRQDAATIRALYLERGFLGVRVGDPEVSLSLDGREASVTFRIEEGRRFTVREVRVPEGLVVPPATMRAWAGIEKGEVFSPARGLRAENALRARFDEMGYPDVRVELRTSADDSGGVVVEFDVAPGQRKTVASVRIEGNERTRDATVLREVGFAPGDPASRARLLETQRRLYQLGIFRSVRVDFPPGGGAGGGGQDVRISVEEAAPYHVSAGLGYDTEGGAQATYSLGHDNVGGYGRSVALQGKYSGVENRMQVVAREPRLFGRRLDTLFTIFRERREETGYDVFTRSLGFRVERRPKPGWVGHLRYSYQDVTLSNVEDALAALEDKLEDVQLGNLSFAVVRNTRDDVFSPTRGGIASAELSVFGPLLLSEETFAKLFLRGAFTKTYRNDVSVSGAARLGLALPLGSTDRVPLSERYFAGGESTLRGFARDAVGPSVEGIPSGGEALGIVNVEWLFPVRGPVRGVLFADAGSVWEDLSSIDAEGLREDAGVGLRILTPIGPVRAEYAWKLDRRPDETPGQFYFAIGILF